MINDASKKPYICERLTLNYFPIPSQQCFIPHDARSPFRPELCTLYIDTALTPRTASSLMFVFYRLIAPLRLCVPKNNSLSTRRCCTTGACVGKRHRHWEAERTSWRSYRATSAVAQTSHSFFTERTDPDSHQSSLTLQFKYVISLC